MNKLHLSILAAALTALAVATPAEAKKKSLVDAVVDAYESNHSFTMPAAGTIEVAFSPRCGTENLLTFRFCSDCGIQLDQLVDIPRLLGRQDVESEVESSRLFWLTRE